MLLSLALILAAGATLQAQQAAATPPAAQAVPLPLSGRAPLAGTVNSVQAAATSAGINTLNPSVQASGSFLGSTPSLQPFSGRLALGDAIARGLAYNLGRGQWSNTVQQSLGQQQAARAALLPNISGSVSVTSLQNDLKVLGFPLSSPFASGLPIPAVVGPAQYMEAEASLSQSIFDMTAFNNYRASAYGTQANQWELQDARDLVVLGVGGAYLGVIAAQARLDAATAELATANAILNQSVQQKNVGALPQLTVDQNQVQAAIQQLQLTTLENDLDKQKINLARMIGLPPTDQYQITDQIPYVPAPPLTLQAALARALEQRADLSAAQAQTEAARAARDAARDERLPSGDISGFYGVIGQTPVTNSHGVYTVTGTLRVPLWQGGKVAGDEKQAEAVLSQRQAELADMRGQIEAQVQAAFLDLATASSQVAVAQNNLKVAHEAQRMSQDRFQAGVINTVELIQAQQAVATAEQDYINSVFAYNLAKLTLARDLGDAAVSWPQYLPLHP